MNVRPRPLEKIDRHPKVYKLYLQSPDEQPKYKLNHRDINRTTFAVSAASARSGASDAVPSEYDAVPSYLGELEVQCIAEPETYADWKLRRDNEIAAFFEALSFLSEGTSLLEQKSSKKILHHHTVTRSRQSKD